MHSQFVVLGGGPGGYTAAFMAADLGMEVTLVEADTRLGGTCLLRGCIPSKALLHVAKVVGEAREMTDWGVEFQSPKFNVDAMRERKEKVIASLSGGLAQLAKKRNVKIVYARGSFENSTSLRLEGGDEKARGGDNQLTFEHCIVATGSVPAKIPAFDIGSQRVMDSTGALELPDIPESLLVVGGGYIGLEMGTVYAEIGSKVSAVELTDGLLPGADRDLVKPLQQKLGKLLDEIMLSTKVIELKEQKDGIAVTFEGPEGRSTKRYSRVLVSVGRKPVSGNLGLENTHVELDQRGFIQVDKQQRTADPHILAIGDVAGEPMLAHKAMHEGKVAAEVLHGEPAAFDALAIPAVVFTDPEIAWAGLTEEQAKKQGREVDVMRYPWAASGRAVAQGITSGQTKMLFDPQSERLLGVGIVGSGAGELIAEGVLAIEMGCTARDLAQTIHTHPTLGETMGNAAELFFGTATEIYKPRRQKQEA